MENLDIIVLSSIVSTLFIVFIGFTAKELMKAPSESQPRQSLETGPRANFIRFIGRIFDEEATKKMNTKQKTIMYNAIKKTIADMESDGVYFPEEIKIELENKRKETTCEYSGLPSVKSYDINQILNK